VAAESLYLQLKEEMLTALVLVDRLGLLILAVVFSSTFYQKDLINKTVSTIKISCQVRIYLRKCRMKDTKI